jgi:hypothetical protein
LVKPKGIHLEAWEKGKMAQRGVLWDLQTKRGRQASSSQQDLGIQSAMLLSTH